MLRWLYIQLIWLHPAPFRWRFGDDMLDDFDRVPQRARLRYLADAVGSLARQWLLRPEFRRPEAPAATGEALLDAAAVPLFETMESYRPRPAALLHGGLSTVLLFVAAVVVIGKGGGNPRPFLIGAHFSRPGLFPIAWNSGATRGLDTTVKLGPNPSDAWLKLARTYFASMPVLRALDSDRDFTLSPSEIDKAAAALRRLDWNQKGRLTAENCGLGIDANSVPPARLAQLRRQFMSDHPVLAALDADGNGEISAREIDFAAAALTKLDRDRNGYLSPDELVPPGMAVAGRRR